MLTVSRLSKVFGRLQVAQDVNFQTDVLLRRGIARSHQYPALIQRMSVLENTRLPARSQTGESARRAPFQRRWQGQASSLAGMAEAIQERLRLRSHYAIRARRDRRQSTGARSLLWRVAK